MKNPSPPRWRIVRIHFIAEALKISKLTFQIFTSAEKNIYLSLNVEPFQWGSELPNLTISFVPNRFEQGHLPTDFNDHDLWRDQNDSAVANSISTTDPRSFSAEVITIINDVNHGRMFRGLVPKKGRYLIKVSNPGNTSINISLIAYTKEVIQLDSGIANYGMLTIRIS
eukprot:TRINITY_DN16607_c0_g1_i1.p1 TRINITY_DN16607_c0_g1~~TRINITY_DN16607_c0_g1_i1.p1  ORF type:complete len:169 (-),score=21.82 TRINITY_DN16607_c0_g1_i1:76-582(-)